MRIRKNEKKCGKSIFFSFFVCKFAVDEGNSTESQLTKMPDVLFQMTSVNNKVNYNPPKQRHHYEKTESDNQAGEADRRTNLQRLARGGGGRSAAEDPYHQWRHLLAKQHGKDRHPVSSGQELITQQF